MSLARDKSSLNIYLLKSNEQQPRLKETSDENKIMSCMLRAGQKEKAVAQTCLPCNYRDYRAITVQSHSITVQSRAITVQSRAITVLGRVITTDASFILTITPID